MTGAPQIDNRSLFTGDNLDVMRAMNSETVDLIYLDPPFNKKFVFPLGDSATSEKGDFGYKDIWGWDTPQDEQNPYLPYAEKRAFDELLTAAADGNPLLERTPAHKAVRFLETVGEVADESQMAYLSFMAMRLFEMKRLLKPTGSIYLHCDPTMSHSLKLLMDIVFGAENFRNEIVWCYASTSSAKKDFPRKHDNIFRYTKADDYVFNADAIRVPYKLSRMPERKNLENRSRGGSGKWKGEPPEKLAARHSAGKVPEDWWQITFGPNSPERTGYPTQKPVALLERIIKASSNEGDFVLDPFCGCATTCIAAERLHRRWCGIDVAKKAYEEVLKRLKKETEQGRLGERVPKVNYCDFNRSDCPIMRTDMGGERSPDRVIRRRLWQEQMGNCRLCKTHFAEPRHFHLDHIIPRSKGGPDADRNLQLLCGSCNSIKGNRTMEWATRRLRELIQAA